MPSRLGVIAAGLGLIVAACGQPVPAGEAPMPVPAAPSTTSATEMPETPPTTAEPSSGLKAACGPVTFDWPTPDLDAFPAFEGDFDTLMGEGAREEYEASRDWWESTAWSIAKQSETELVLFGRESAAYQGQPQFAYAIFEVIDGERRARGWGGCRIQVVTEGFGIATFEIDRTNPPDSASTALYLRATERACASGQVPTGREIRSVVNETGDTVEIIVLVESFTGSGVQTCPSNPSFPLTVELDAPLGQRTIRDVAIYPGRDLPWPPPPADPILSLHLAGTPPSSGTANVFAWDGDYAGAILLGPGGWSEFVRDDGWVQGFFQAVTVTGFVADCGAGGCPEEVEGAEVDTLTRLGPECTATWTPVPGEETIMTISYSQNTCTIEATSEPIGDGPG